MRNKKKLCAGILMLLLLTGCSSQEVLQEVPQTIVLPDRQYPDCQILSLQNQPEFQPV